jgi:hypothetical protein
MPPSCHGGPAARRQAGGLDKGSATRIWDRGPAGPSGRSGDDRHIEDKRCLNT